MPYRPPHKKWGIIVGVAVVAIVVSFLIAAVSTHARRKDFRAEQAAQSNVDKVICRRVNRLYLAIQDQVRIALANNPKIEYYKTHPGDLARAQAQLKEQLQRFAPQPCPGDDSSKKEDSQ